MPGYKWTVHRPAFKGLNYLEATGIQSSGFNRLSTLSVVVRWDDDVPGSDMYKVKSSGFGKDAPWLSDCTGSTLARALRGLQNYYESMASKYSGHAYDLKTGRKLSIVKEDIESKE